MSTGQPFFFDTHIFEPEEDYSSLDDKRKRPEFTRDDLDAAKQSAFEEGRKAGLQEAEASLKQTALGILQKIGRDISVLFAAEKERNDRFEEECLHLVFGIVQKLYPLYCEKHGLNELEGALRNALRDHTSTQPVKVEMHSSLREHINDLISQYDADQNVDFVFKDTLNAREFKLLWPDGGLVVAREKIAMDIMDAMKVALAERGINVHDEDQSGQTDQSDDKHDTTGDA